MAANLQECTTNLNFSNKRRIAFDYDDAKWKDIRSTMQHFLSSGSFKGTDLATLHQEAQKTVELLIKKTQQHGSVNPLSFIRSNAINIILATAFGQQGARSLHDPLYRYLMYKNDLHPQYPSIWKPWSWMSHLRRLFSKETTSMDALYAPLRRVVQRARTSDQDNMVKRIDLLKEEYVIDERDVTVITGEK